MALASDADVERALGRFLNDGEDVSLLLEEASDRVVAFLGHTPDPVPPAVSRAVARMVERAINKPHTTTAQYGVSGYMASQQPLTYRDDGTGDPWLSKTIKDMLRPHRRRTPAFSIHTTGENPPPTIGSDWPVWRRR